MRTAVKIEDVGPRSHLLVSQTSRPCPGLRHILACHFGLGCGAPLSIVGAVALEILNARAKTQRTGSVRARLKRKGRGGYSVVAEKDEGNAHAPPMFSHS
jgi:hypothetical protein